MSACFTIRCQLRASIYIVLVTLSLCTKILFGIYSLYVSLRHSFIVLSFSSAAEAMMFSVGWHAQHSTTSATDNKRASLHQILRFKINSARQYTHAARGSCGIVVNAMDLYVHDPGLSPTEYIWVVANGQRWGLHPSLQIGKCVAFKIVAFYSTFYSLVCIKTYYR